MAVFAELFQFNNRANVRSGVQNRRGHESTTLPDDIKKCRAYNALIPI